VVLLTVTHLFTRTIYVQIAKKTVNWDSHLGSASFNIFSNEKNQLTVGVRQGTANSASKTLKVNSNELLETHVTEN